MFILLLIFFCQKLAKILDETIEGKIPVNIIFSMLGLGIPEIIQFILPLSLFLGLLVKFSQLYNESEITAMHSCGLSKSVLIKASMILAFITSIMTTLNVMWIGPWYSRQQYKVIAEAKTSSSISILTQGKFHQVFDGNSVLFIESVDGSYFHNIFLAQIHPKNSIHPTIVIADSGQLLQCRDGSQILKMNKGTRFEVATVMHGFRITDFYDYQAIIKHQATISDPLSTEQMDISTLWNTDSKLACAELHWRTTLVFAVFIMALISVPLSVISSRRDYMLSIILAILLYLLFFLIQTTIKSNFSNGRISFIFWMWIVNLIYLSLALLLNLCDTVIVRRIRNYFCIKNQY